jgi:hypothetical protein
MIEACGWRWPSLAELETAAGLACSLVTLASAICALTPTPPPSSGWARLYRLIEIAGLVVGHAKETGLAPPVPPAVDAFTRRAQDFLATLGKSGLAVVLLALLAGSAAPPAPLAGDFRQIPTKIAEPAAAPMAPVAPPPTQESMREWLARSSTFVFERDTAGRLVTRPLTPPRLTPR